MTVQLGLGIFQFSPVIMKLGHIRNSQLDYIGSCSISQMPGFSEN